MPRAGRQRQDVAIEPGEQRRAAVAPMAAPSIVAASAIAITCRKKIRKTKPPVRAQRFEDGDVDALAIQEGRRSPRWRRRRPRPAPSARPGSGTSPPVRQSGGCRARRRCGRGSSSRRRERRAPRRPGSCRWSRRLLGLGRERDAIGVIDQAAGRDQAGRRQRRGGNQHVRPQREAGGDAVRLAVQHAR